MIANATKRMAKPKKKSDRVERPEQTSERDLIAFIDANFNAANSPAPKTYTEQIKFSADFRDKLKEIAAFASKYAGRDVYMGEIVERLISKRIGLLHLFALRLKSEAAEAEVKESEVPE